MSATHGDGSPAPARGATELAAAVARQAGIALDAVTGSGAGGRVLADDVLAAAGVAAPAARTAEPEATVARARERITPIAPRDGVEVIEPDRVRRVVAERLTLAKREQPHYYMSVDVDVDPLLELRALLNENAAPEARISLNDILVKIVATILGRDPALNAAWIDGRVHRYAEADIAVAVATPRGLLTPVLRAPRRLRLAEIAFRIRDLAERAGRDALRPDELSGGTFTISNLGMHGVDRFAAILNPPQAAILAVGTAEPRAIARDGAPAVATRMTCTLSVDHRVADGVEGARFLAELERLAAEPRALLL